MVDLTCANECRVPQGVWNRECRMIGSDTYTSDMGISTNIAGVLVAGNWDGDNAAGHSGRVHQSQHVVSI